MPYKNKNPAMLNEFKKLKKSIVKFKIRQFIRTYLNAVIKLLVTIGLCFCVLITILIFYDAGAFAIRIISAGIVLIAGFFFCRNIIKIIKTHPLSLSYLNKTLEDDYHEIEDRLINTLSLYNSKKDYSSPIALTVIDGLLRSTVSLLKKIPSGYLSLAGFYKNSIALVTVLILFGILTTTNAVYRLKEGVFEKPSYFLIVSPGNTRVVKNTDVKISVHTNLSGLPKIEIRRLGDRILNNFSPVSKTTFTYTIIRIREKIKYRVLSAARRRKSSWYEIDIKTPPAADELVITYNYPLYTGYEVRKSTERIIEALRGTSVEIEVKSFNGIKDAWLKTSKGEFKMKVLPPDTALVKFILEDENFYQIVLEDSDGLKNYDSPKYPVNVLIDRSPIIEITFPSGDLQVPPDAKVSIEGYARDDIGLRRVYISYYIDIAGREESETIKVLKDRLSSSFSYIWDIAATDAVPGSIITYHLIAEDINTLYGPGVGYSGKMTLEVVGFGEKHSEILEKTSDFQEKIIVALLESYDITSLLEQSEFHKASENLKDFEVSLKELQEFLDNLISEMETDPLMEAATIDEHSGMSKTLKSLTNKDLPRLKEATSESKPESIGISEEISSHLERMMKLSQDAIKREKMSDMLSSSAGTLEKAKDIADMLGKDDITPKDIQKKLDKLKHLLDEMRKAIMDFPSELPDEFIHSESIQKIDFSDAESKISELEKALREGDFDKARSILDGLMSSLSAIMGTLNQAAAGAHSSRREQLMTRTNELQKKLEEIVRHQKELISATVGIDEMAKIKREHYEKEHFKEILVKFSTLKSTTGIRSREIDKEFSTGYLYRTPEMLKDIMERTDNRWKKEKIKEFLNNLKRKPSEDIFFNEEQKNNLIKAATDQFKLKEDVIIIREALSALSHHTAMLDMEILENLDIAGVFMGKASSHLYQFQTPLALSSQRTALSYLLHSSSQMKSFSQKLQAIPQQLGGAAGMQFHPTTGGMPGGRTGFREGYVEIPARGEEISGREFRKMILDALKKKHPEEYKELIKEYFKDLSE